MTDSLASRWSLWFSRQWSRNYKNTQRLPKDSLFLHLFCFKDERGKIVIAIKCKRICMQKGCRMSRLGRDILRKKEREPTESRNSCCCFPVFHRADLNWVGVLWSKWEISSKYLETNGFKIYEKLEAQSPKSYSVPGNQNDWFSESLTK